LGVVRSHPRVPLMSARTIQMKGNIL